MFHKTLFVIALTMIVSISSDDAVAQKEGEQEQSFGIFNSQQEYGEFFGGLKQLNDPEVNAMLPTLNDIVLGQPIGDTAMRYGTKSTGLVELLGDQNVRKDLDIADSQYEELKQLNSDFQKQVAEQMKSIDMTNSKSILETVGAITKSAETQFEDVLLPHQIERLQQLSVRNQLRRKSLAEVITTDPIATELEVTESQKTEILDAEKEIEAELEREIATLRKKARDKLLSKLKGGQRKKFDEMIGDEFEFAARPKQSKRKKGKKEGSKMEAEK